jgi:alpha-L-rhamnosidase
MQKFFRVMSVLLACFSIFSACTPTENSNCRPVNLRVNYTVNPIGIDTSNPLFSWEMDDARLGARQTAWQVLVASSPELLKNGKADLWDSGKQLTTQSGQIVYGGQPLTSCSRYFWTVKVWDKDGKVSIARDPALFEMGYLNRSDWKGQWITHTEDTVFYPAPYFRKVLTLKDKPIRATAYVAGIGYHELYVNNQKVGNSYLEPGYTRFDRRTLYVTYDVTNLLAGGNNCIGAVLRNGWYNVQSKAVWYFEKAPWRKSPRLLMDLRLEYADGTVEFVSTDETWKWNEGPVRFNSLYAGEIYDARKELGSWSLAGYDESGWLPVLLTHPPGGLISAQAAPAIKVVRELKPIRVYTIRPGKYVFDMGENFAGTATLKISGSRGTQVTLLFGEQLNDDYSVNPEIIARHMRLAKGALPFQTDIYYLKGEGPEVYTPRFTYHGYRYVDVTTEPVVDLTQIQMTGLFFSTASEKAGDFNCSNELLNKLYHATMNSYQSNFQSIPTDCPHREKNGWTGDAHIASELGLWNFNSIMAYRKWLQDLRDEQRPGGELPGIVPTSGWGYQWGNGPAWDSALPVITWNLYEYYGDTTVLQENYEAIKLYVDYLTTRADKGIQHIGLGDWVSLTQTPVEVTSTGYYYYDTQVLSKMAGILGNTADQQKYAALASEIKAAFNAMFFDAETNHYKVQTQTALSCAIFQQLVPDGAMGNTVADLIARINEKDNHPDFGLLGSKYVLNVLRETGHNDLAYTMINQTGFPSWGHWIELGATALWEDWDGREGSQNHIFLGDFSTWFFKALGGIQVDPEHPGFKHFFLKPYFPDGMSFAEVSHNCLQGKIVSNWKRKGNQIVWDVVVPANSRASVILSSDIKIEKVQEKMSGQIAMEAQPVMLPAGQYTITLNPIK